MLYTANTNLWRKGDIVLQDVDRKCPRMFMVVIGYSRDGLCKTQYVDRKYHSRKVYKNEIAYLHDPRRFDLYGTEKQEDWELINWWNCKYQVGQMVEFQGLEYSTQSKASFLKGTYPVIWLDGYVGAVQLRHVKAKESNGVNKPD